MYTARIENRHGESLVLTGAEDKWQIASIDGLGPVNANLLMTDLAGLDGARFNSANLTTRNIVITLAIKGNVEANRQKLYRFFKTKEQCTFFFQNENRNVFAPGYVESVDVGLFDKKQTMQISIICPDSYFRSTAGENIDITYTVPLFEFPFAIDEDDPIEFSEYIGQDGIKVVNNSETSTGVKIKVVCLMDVSTFTIEDTTTGQKFTLTYPFLSGDIVTINTEQGQKSIRLKRGAANTNIFSALDVTESEFLQLAQGENFFHFSADGGDGDSKIKVTMSFNEKYRGV